MLHTWRKVYYSPDDDLTAVVQALPMNATQSLDCEVYGFTDARFVANLLAAARRGVRVRVMADRTQSSGHAQHALLQQLVDARLETIEVRIVRSSRGAIDHLKLVIVDGAAGAEDNASSVVYGSYNLSADTAEREDNVLAWTNASGEVAQALAKFEADWSGNEQNADWQLTPSPVPVAPASPG